MVGLARFELAASGSANRRSIQMSYSPSMVRVIRFELMTP